MRSVLACVGVLAMTAQLVGGCRSTSTALDERVPYWRAIVTRELPIGSSREDIEAWGVRRGIALKYTEQLRWLTGNLEQVVVPNEGPCDTWTIGITTTMATARLVNGG
jgi:hypothetical protein